MPGCASRFQAERLEKVPAGGPSEENSVPGEASAPARLPKNARAEGTNASDPATATTMAPATASHCARATGRSAVRAASRRARSCARHQTTPDAGMLASRAAASQSSLNTPAS